MLASRSWRWAASPALVVLWLTSLATSSPAALLINEVLYDPPGSDGDLEFVELYNSGVEAVDLAGVELLFINGSAPDLPRTVWVGRAGMSVGAQEWFVVGEAGVRGADATASLDLQNGSEALWLRRGESILDRVAWGDDLGLGRGRPAADVSSRSLGRVPDGVDTGDNRDDFSALDPPNAGGENAPAEDLRLLRWQLSPPWSARAGQATVELEFEAVGYAPAQSIELLPPPEAVSPASPRLLEVARGDTRSFTVAVDLERSTRRLNFVAGADTLKIPIQVGPDDLRLNEVQARPLPGEPEWIELHHVGADSLDLRGWSIADATGTLRELARTRLGPGERILFSADPSILTPVRPTRILRPDGGWPSLNQSDALQSDGQRFADELLLFDARGAVVDWVRWSANSFDEAGRSLERARVGAATPDLWVPAPRGGSPGGANEAARYEVAESGLRLDPNPFTPDADGVEDFLVVSLHDQELAGEVEAEILDLSGDRVARLEAARTNEVVQWIWDGRDGRGRIVEGGAYVVHVHAASGSNLRRLIAVGATP